MDAKFDIKLKTQVKKEATVAYERKERSQAQVVARKFGKIITQYYVILLESGLPAHRTTNHKAAWTLGQTTSERSHVIRMDDASLQSWDAIAH